MKSIYFYIILVIICFACSSKDLKSKNEVIENKKVKLNFKLDDQLVSNQDINILYTIDGNTPFEDDMLIINMSVWESIEQLKDFVYDTAHSYFVKSRKKWFNQMESQHMALWWVDSESMPTLEEAADKLKQLDQEGASEEVFDFKWALKNL